MCAAARTLVFSKQQVLNVSRAILLKFTNQQAITVSRSITAKLHEHLPEFSPAFVADFPGFTAVLVVFWNIFRIFIDFCVFFRIAVKMCHFSQNFMGGGYAFWCIIDKVLRVLQFCIVRVSCVYCAHLSHIDELIVHAYAIGWRYCVKACSVCLFYVCILY